MFLQTLRKNAATRTEKELKEYSKEIRTSEERIERLDKIIESLYEDKVEGKISEERYLKMSGTYKTEQAGLKERVKTLKSEIAKAKEDDDIILDFMMLTYKYNSFEELTPEIFAALHKGDTKLTAHEDFNDSVCENHDKINFLKRWTHSDTQLGAALSLEEVMENDRDAVENAADFFSPAESTEEAYMELRNGFLATLSEDDRVIFIMRENGKTQKEIAEALGYKTHSAVTKRLQAMREQFEMYIKEQG